MGIFSFFKQKDFFTPEEERKITEAIRKAETRTSGEVRVFIESRCRFVDPLDRAMEIFYGLKMDQTKERNAVLVYIAIKDHQLAVFGDEGIHRKTGTDFWKHEVQLMVTDFNRSNYADGLVKVVTEIGDALHTHFPYDEEVDKNELPDNIVFGK